MKLNCVLSPKPRNPSHQKPHTHILTPKVTKSHYGFGVKELWISIPVLKVRNQVMTVKKQNFKIEISYQNDIIGYMVPTKCLIRS